MVKCGVRGVVVTIFVLGAIAVFASSAFAGSVQTVLKDASDGVVDGSYSGASVRSALKLVRSDPVYSQYSDIEGVLVDYLSGFGAATTSSGTGGGSSTGGSGGSAGATDSNAQATGQGSGAGSASDSDGGGGIPASVGGGTPVSTAGLVALPVPDVSGVTQARSRLMTLPWFYVLLGLGCVAGVYVLRVRRSG